MSAELPPARPSLTWWPIVGAAIVALIGVAVVIFIGSGGDNRVGAKVDSKGALVCPSSYEQNPRTGKDFNNGWVPIQATGIDGSGSLVPTPTPLHVTLCRYDGVGVPAGQTDIALSSSTTLTAGQSALTKQLSKAPKARTRTAHCPATTSNGTDYLIGLVFATGKIWVSVPADSCLSASNGQYTTSDDLRTAVKNAFASRHWS